MKKKTLIYIAILLAPLAAAVLAGMSGSVTVIDGQSVSYCSFHDEIPGASLGICLLLSVLLNDLCFGVGVLYGITKKPVWLKTITVLAFCAMTLAVLPILADGGTRVLPNMWIPLLMGGECAFAYLLSRKPMEEKPRTGPRLK